MELELHRRCGIQIQLYKGEDHKLHKLHKVHTMVQLRLHAFRNGGVLCWQDGHG